MGYPRKATPELLTLLEEVARRRIEAESIPSDKHLARQTGFSEKLIQRWMGRLRRALGVPAYARQDGKSDIAISQQAGMNNPDDVSQQ